jgi:hypothetical protein
MKKFFLFIVFAVCFSLLLYSQQKNIGNSKVMQPTTQTANNNNNNKTINQNVSLPNQVIPIPRKIVFFSKNPQLTLMSGNVIAENIKMNSSSRGFSSVSFNQSDQQSKIKGSPVGTQKPTEVSDRTKAGLLAVVSKNVGGTRVGFALTNNLSNFPPVTDPKSIITPKMIPTPNRNPPPNPSWNCATAMESVSAQSISFMNASKDENGVLLFPGAIYTFNDYSVGNPKPVEAGRNPIEVFTDAMGRGYNNSSIKVGLPVQNPTHVNIHQAISNIVSQFSPNQGGVKVMQQTFYSNNLSDFSISVSGGGSYDAFSFADNYKQTQTEHHIYVTVDVIKPMFTMSVTRPSNGYFVNGQEPQTSSPLVLIQNVTYGARLIANLDIIITANTNMNNFQGAYTTIGAGAYVNIDNLSHDTTISKTINSYMVGVPASTGIITTLDNFEAQLNTIMSKCNYSTAVPIQYTLSDMDGNALGIESMTDQYPVTNCVPATDVYKLTQAYLNIRTGMDNKNAGSLFKAIVNGVNSNGGYVTGQYSNENDEFKANSTTGALDIYFQTNQDHPNITWDDFKKGGTLVLQLYNEGKDPFRKDDWDIQNFELILLFTSQKGNTQKKTLKITGDPFRLSVGGKTVMDDRKYVFNSDFEVEKF